MTDAPTEILPAAATAAAETAPAHPAVSAPDSVAPQPVAAGSCRSCSAPLAADQRYCLSCGARVAAPRVDWATALGGPTGGAAAPPEVGAGARVNSRWALMLDRIGGPMGAAAVVLVALGVGFLLGQGGSGPSGPATIIQRPPIVNVQGGGTVAPSSTSGADTTAGGGAKRDKHAGGSTAGIPKATTKDNSGGDLNRLRAQPKEQATGGSAPKKDHKVSGGGSATESIG